MRIYALIMTHATPDTTSLKVPISEERLMRTPPAVAGVPQEPVRTMVRPTETFQSVMRSQETPKPMVRPK